MLVKYSGWLCLLFGFSFFYACTSKNRKATPSSLNNNIPIWVKDTFYEHPYNTFTVEKARLGRYLFYDRRLSVNNTKACASCHAQQFSFTDAYTKSIGAYGDLHLRNAKPLINLIFEKYLTAADSTLHFPEQQMVGPMYNQHPIEMGWQGNETLILQRLQNDELYHSLFTKAYPKQPNPYTVENVQWAIASFIKTVFSFNAPYDKYLSKIDTMALTPTQKKGMQLFFSKKLNCAKCHHGINFTSSNYYISPHTAITIDSGLYRATHQPIDIGKFKPPTLRNLAFTAPYLYNGTAATLEEVLLHYEKDIQGKMKTEKLVLDKAFKLTSQERSQLVAFLLSLSDSSVLINSNYANPFSIDETN